MSSNSLTVVLDANVLYPFFQRDLLLSLGYEELYIPKWSDEIEQEWIHHLKKDRPDISDKLNRTVDLMNKSFPDAKIRGYKEHIEHVELPDKNDRHVLASGIQCGADYIITYNLPDFPEKELSKYDIEAVEPDSFLLELISRDVSKVWNAIQSMVAVRTNPPVTVQELVREIAERGMIRSAAKLSEDLKK